MSDVVVIETAPAEIVEVVAAGPQGPVGDVNPQMPIILAATEAARDAALVSELAASASQSAAATSAANAATSESNAATSAATATAQATASAGSATASAGSAAAAQASATNAATSETNAANSATASANSATSSANSATAAQAAQTATESARDTTLATIGTAALKANNLSDLASIPTALINLGLNNVSNTSDANKPISTATQAALDLKENAANKGVANGYAGLDATGKVPAAQLPSYVDDVLEYANLAAFPVTGEAGKIYVALDTNKTYRWSGSTYIYITPGAVDSVAGKTGVVVLAKSDVGLGNVDNTSDADKPVSAAAQAALNLKADAASPTTTGTLTHSGDIVLSGSGKRITGDFSNATVANRVMFQTSTVNGATVISAIPNGTSANAQFRAINNSGDPANASWVAIQSATTESQVLADRSGTGTYLPMTFYTGGSERMRIDTSGNVGIGTSSPSTALYIYRTATDAVGTFQGLQTSSGGTGKGAIQLDVNGKGGFSIVCDATSGTRALTFNNNNGYGSGTAEAMRIDSSGNVGIGVSPSYNLHVRNPGGNCTMYGQYGTGTYGGWVVGANGIFANINGVNVLQVDTSNNVLQTQPAGLGYGYGAGGTVTQATSKSTAVTLNKPTGQITTASDALAAGAYAGFVLNNSLLGADDVLVVSARGGGAGNEYQAWVSYTQAGAAVICLKNNSGGSRSEAVLIKFAIIKGAVV